MSRVIFLDSGPLGLASNPLGSPEANRCNMWVEALLLSGTFVAMPEIADYEVRRELLRANKIAGIRRLNMLKSSLRYIPLTTETMLRAARFWADARNRGKPTADDKALDGDVILAAQAVILAEMDNVVTVATTNIGHLSLFCHALHWQDIHV